MNARISMAAVAGATLALCVASGVWAQSQRKTFGQREYESNCAGCHGLKGKGDGPYKPYLTKSPTDLTVLARNNNGVFPYVYTYEIVDGRREVALHGPRDMPIWGFDYLAKARADYADVKHDDETYVRTRIEALLDHLKQLQVKEPKT